MPFKTEPPPPERPLDERWHGRPVGSGGPDRHADVLVNALWSNGITSRGAARRQGTSLQRLAAYLGVSAAVMTRIVERALAKGVVDTEDVPDLERGGLRGKVVWLSEKGIAAAPTTVDSLLLHAGQHGSVVSGANVTVHVRLGAAEVVPMDWTPVTFSDAPECPVCHAESRTRTPGRCPTHRWKSTLLGGHAAGK